MAIDIRSSNLLVCSSAPLQGMTLTPHEEAIMRSYYQSKVQDICEALEFSLAVMSDAHLFLHNYFTKHSILDHDAKHVM